MPPKLNAMRKLLPAIVMLSIVTITSAQGLLRYLPVNSATSSPGFQIKADYLPRFHVKPFSPLNFGCFTNAETAAFKIQPLPVVYTVKDLPMFCKWEVKLEKAATFPVKFRLGEVQYVEHLEGKY
jgi:hypothetical protein